jgi:hypothetical protein
MFGLLETVIVTRMDIGKTIRCYTVEPLRDPVPAPREYSVRVPDRDPVAGPAAPSGDSPLDYVLAPTVLRRISG